VPATSNGAIAQANSRRARATARRSRHRGGAPCPPQIPAYRAAAETARRNTMQKSLHEHTDP
jgi:hypothetical protein